MLYNGSTNFGSFVTMASLTRKEPQTNHFQSPRKKHKHGLNQQRTKRLKLLFVPEKRRALSVKICSLVASEELPTQTSENRSYQNASPLPAVHVSKIRRVISQYQRVHAPRCARALRSLGRMSSFRLCQTRSLSQRFRQNMSRRS